MKKFLIITILCIMLIPFSAFASEKEINIHLFYGQECPHCEKETEFLYSYIKENENIKLYRFEVWHNKNNQKRFSDIQELLGKEATGVPYLVIGNQVITGYYASYTQEKIKEIIDYYEKNDYRDIIGEYLGVSEVNADIELLDKEILTNATLPILGEVDPTTVSLPLLAVIIGAVDGFNPCAMWILLFLITMLLGMKNRKKMWILGFTFIVTSGLVYLLFMVSWLNFAMFVNQINWVRFAIGLFAIIFGLYNIVKYYKTRKEQTGCEVVNDIRRKKIALGIKKIASEKKFILAMLGIIILAISVNIIELFCSLGLPLLFTQILSLNSLSTFEYIIYMFIYILFFLIDDIIIFAIAMKTLKIKVISNTYTKYSHLIGGIIMFVLGVLMIFKPDWLMFNF